VRSESSGDNESSEMRAPPLPLLCSAPSHAIINPLGHRAAGKTLRCLYRGVVPLEAKKYTAEQNSDVVLRQASFFGTDESVVILAKENEASSS
jgi:hypothetical protein